MLSQSYYNYIFVTLVFINFYFVIYHHFHSVPKTVRHGCILYQGVVYCVAHFDVDCSKGYIACCLSYLSSILANLLWLFIFSLLLHYALRVITNVFNQRMYDAQQQFYLSSARTSGIDNIILNSGTPTTKSVQIV